MNATAASTTSGAGCLNTSVLFLSGSQRPPTSRPLASFIATWSWNMGTNRLTSLRCLLRQVLDEREDRVCLCFNHLLQHKDLLSLVVEGLHHCYDVRLCLHCRLIRLI